MYVAQQGTNAAAAAAVAAGAQQKVVGAGGGGWQGYKKGGIGGAKNMRVKAPPKPQQLHYCDVCKIR